MELRVKGEFNVDVAGAPARATLRFSEREADIHIDSVFVPSVGRGRGVGAGLIRRVFVLADAAGRPVVLEARPIGSRGPDAVARLVRFYERLGFRVENPTESAPSMRRLPSVRAEVG